MDLDSKVLAKLRNTSNDMPTPLIDYIENPPHRTKRRNIVFDDLVTEKTNISQVKCGN